MLDAWGKFILERRMFGVIVVINDLLHLLIISHQCAQMAQWDWSPHCPVECLGSTPPAHGPFRTHLALCGRAPPFHADGCTLQGIPSYSYSTGFLLPWFINLNV
ncbi:MAG: hypothetical protein EZS28_020477 [Streblomastix strix]|uniref:Uncharacterized protein n=1 Tax=Streblomastix strix TaxID=222440 RepID=A0A5J4VNH2_9EUKA|nr:MAG: hypothetical protein EZS28_020477 [Streblomastix strix]